MAREMYGFFSTICACEECKAKCRHLSGMVAPADLLHWQTLYPAGYAAWAMTSLAASPGALVFAYGGLYRIRTIVPARLPAGTCTFLLADESCGIHAHAPYGCAFFDHGMSGDAGNERSHAALSEIARDWQSHGPYSQLWQQLYDTGNRVEAPELARQTLRELEEKSRAI